MPDDFGHEFARFNLPLIGHKRSLAFYERETLPGCHRSAQRAREVGNRETIRFERVTKLCFERTDLNVTTFCQIRHPAGSAAFNGSTRTIETFAVASAIT